ncbi:hypothetical protein AB1Y20_009693 [Prymnesium parvum]|uniref:Peroxisomal membrane protein PEX16 n=1 Tax=Prymnesium parvum TaxID=97485 RepID=A0AB34K7A6_PRYPA
MLDEAAELHASRLGALICALQSAEYLVEAAATRIFGEDGGWLSVTLVEAWRTLCRVRLLAAQRPAALLLRSTPSETHRRGREPWGDVVRSIRGDGLLRERANQRQQAAFAPGLRCSSAHFLGEVLHAVQPLVYLLMLMGQRMRHCKDGHRTGVVARLPWLTSLVIEVVAFHLCSRATLGPAASTLDVLRLMTAQQSCAKDPQTAIQRSNLSELEHRRKLLLLFLLRPAARSITRSLLVQLRDSTAQNTFMRRWSEVVLELVDGLDSSCAYRYFRTCPVSTQMKKHSI